MASGIEIRDKNGNIIMSNDDLTTYAIGQAKINMWENKTIQNNALIGKDFWYAIQSFDSYPQDAFQSTLGCGYYIPKLSYDKNSGTANFTWETEIYNSMHAGGFEGFTTMIMGVSNINIIYGGI